MKCLVNTRREKSSYSKIGLLGEITLLSGAVPSFDKMAAAPNRFDLIDHNLSHLFNLAAEACAEGLA
jgi:hypothetical protein